MPVAAVPEGYHTVCPYLSIKGATKALAFYAEAFGAQELFRMEAPDGSIAHAEIRIGDSPIMMADACEMSPMSSPGEAGGSTVGIHLYVENVDALYAQALAAGAEVVKAVEDQFFGDRMGTLKDPFGHVWFLSTHIEDLSPEEIGERAAALFGEGANQQ